MKEIQNQINDHHELLEQEQWEEIMIASSKDERTFINQETMFVLDSLSEEQYREYVK